MVVVGGFWLYSGMKFIVVKSANILGVGWVSVIGEVFRDLIGVDLNIEFGMLA